MITELRSNVNQPTKLRIVPGKLMSQSAVEPENYSQKQKM